MGNIVSARPNCYYSNIIATDNIWMDVYGCLLIKLQLWAPTFEFHVISYTIKYILQLIFFSQ